jgi:phosphate:Na+ symporter
VTAADTISLLLPLSGGLAVFIFGMIIMTEGLRQGAGPALRSLLNRSTRNGLAGVSTGTVLGLLIQSSATTVMLVGFLNAGLITLASAIPPIIGANVGTTLSMQIISFRVGELWYVPVIAGVILQLARSHTPLKFLGVLATGFGLLFLGMNLMSDAVVPHRDAIGAFLAPVHGDTLQGMLGGILLSAAITSLVHSSGATIGMCFALTTAGVFTRLDQVYPIVLGAHIGTCVTALLASIGSNIEARRAAVAHLAFNIVGVVLAVAAAPFFFTWLPRTSGDLIHQTANLHTATMVLAALVTFPAYRPFARLIAALVPTRQPLPVPTLLDNGLLETPEQALCAAISELQRVARICVTSFRLNAEIIFKMDRRKVATIRRNEAIVNEIQVAMRAYLTALTNRYLSRRQAVLIQHLNRCMTDIERIGDHNDNLCDLSEGRHHNRKAVLDRDANEALLALYKSAEDVLKLVIESLDPALKDFHTFAKAILQARDAYVEKSLTVKSMFTEKTATHQHAPIVGFYLNEYVTGFDRIVRHSKMIALVESHPYFWIKRQKLDRAAPEAPDYPPPPPQDPHDFLDKLQTEGYV